MEFKLHALIKKVKEKHKQNNKINIFTTLLDGFVKLYRVDQCSLVMPNYNIGKWQFITGLPYTKYHSSKTIKDLEYDLEELFSSKREVKQRPDILQKINKGICNAVLYTKTSVTIDDVHNTNYQYVNINDKINHEIVIPVIIKGQVANCIIFDFYGYKHYEILKRELNNAEDIENILGRFFSEYIYTYKEKLWNKAYIELSRLKKINLDDELDAKKLNNILSNLWPGLKYYSIWTNTTNLTIDSHGKGFVQIGTNFADEKKNKKIIADNKATYIDYVFTDSDEITYTTLLKKSLKRFVDSGQDDKSLIQSMRVTMDTYSPIHPRWHEILFSGETMFDLHFIPLTDVIEEGGKEKLIIGSIFIYFFDCLKNPHVVKEERVELLSRLIYEKIKHARAIKIKKFLSKIYQITSDNVKQTDTFMEQIAEELLNTIPSEVLDIWLIGKKGITSYMLKHGQSETAKSIVEDTYLAQIKESCFDKGAPFSKISKMTSKGISDDCMNVLNLEHLKKQKINVKSWMIINISGMGGSEKALVFFYNRLHSGRIKAFSEYDRIFTEEISKDLGTLLSIYELWEKEENLKAALPHEIMSPIGNLALGLKTIEEHTDEFFSYTNETNAPVFKSLKESIHECLTLLATIKNSTDNYIRFLKNDNKKIQKKQISIINLLKDIKEAVLYKFNNGKYLYINLQKNISPKIKANETMLFSVINNIYDNAFKYCNEYSVFTIIVEEGQSAVTISFTSYGKGLDREDLSRVFILNYQGKNIQKDEYEYWKGKGIGLTLSKFLIENCHGGQIYFKRSEYICKYNPFYLYMLKNLTNTHKLKKLYKDQDVPEEILELFEDKDIRGFFLNLADEEKMTPLAVEYYLANETFANEIVIELPII